MKNSMLRCGVANEIALILTFSLLTLAAHATTIQPLPSRNSATSPSSPENAGDSHGRLAMYGRLPLSFEANQGQTDSRVKFLSRANGSTVFLTSTEAVVVLSRPVADHRRDRVPLVKPDSTRLQQKVTRTAVRMTLQGANPAPGVAGLEELPGKVNYFIGNDPAKWRTNVPTYAKVRYENIYRGIDLVYYGNQRQLEYDFVVRPGADPKTIALGFQGADKLEVNAQGDLVLHTAAGTIHQRKPIIYQYIDGLRREVAGSYVRRGARRVGFQVAAYDARRPLVIDPVLVYSTHLGAGALGVGHEGLEGASGIAIDTLGNAYVTGGTLSTNFPTTTGAFQTTVGINDANAFVTKLGPTGSALVYSTYLGGNDTDGGSAIAVDASGSVYVAGLTVSSDFPTTVGAFQTSGGRAFVAKLDSSGSSLVYSTHLGTGADIRGIALDALGNAYVTGDGAIPTTVGAFQTTPGGERDAFVAKINPAGSGLVYSTYLGGTADEYGFGIALDASGSAYVTGMTKSANFPTTAGAFQITPGGGNCFGPCSDAFVTKLDPSGSALVYSTYLGGTRDDVGNAIAVDVHGNAYVTGQASNANSFPTTAGAFQTTSLGINDGNAFVTKLDVTGSTLVYSTYLGGGTESESAFGIAVSASGSAYVTGATGSTDFPTTPGAFQTTVGGGLRNMAFVTRLDPAGSGLVYSTYFTGSQLDIGVGIAVDASGNAYVTGGTDSTDFPTTPGAFQTVGGGVFVAKFAIPNTPTGSNVSVSAGDGVTATFAAVSSSGETAATANSSGPPPPAGFNLGASSYYAITTTASFGPPVTICIAYASAQFDDPSSLRLFHFEGSAWVDVTTSNNTGTGIICGQTGSLSPFLIAERTSLAVTIDIKPGSYPNTINLGSNGVVPVAIMSTPTFDARTVDPSTVTLANAAVKLKGNGKPNASFQDVNGDGRLDLVVHVETSALELTPTDTIAVLKGRTFSGQPIKGSDSVRIVPQ